MVSFGQLCFAKFAKSVVEHCKFVRKTTQRSNPLDRATEKNTLNINCENNHAHMLTLVFFLRVFMCVGNFLCAMCDVCCIFIQYTLVGYCLHVETGFKRMDTFAVNIELNPVIGKYQQISLRIVYVSSNWAGILLVFSLYLALSLLLA